MICADPEIDAVIIATPNFTHRPIALAAIRARQARDVRKAAGSERRRSARDVPRGRDASVVHMTAFTYRFAPVDAVSASTWSRAARWASRGTFAASGFSTGPRRVGAGGSISTRPARATCST